MTLPMRVSFVVVSHNRLRELNLMLGSLVVQDTKVPFEVVLVDNDSDDQEGIASIARRHGERMNISLHLRTDLKHGMSLASARNLGVERARGDWIASLDSDELVRASYLPSVLRLVEESSPKQIFVGRRIFVDSSGLTLSSILEGGTWWADLIEIPSSSNHGRILDKRWPEIAALPGIEHPWDYAHGGNVVYSRQVALACGGQDVEFDGNHGYEDIEFAHRMVSRMGCSINYAPDLNVYHLEPSPEDSQPAKLKGRRNPNWVRVCEKIAGYEQYKVEQYRRLDLSFEL